MPDHRRLSAAQQKAIEVFRACRRTQIDGWIYGGLPHGVRRSTAHALRRMGILEEKYPVDGACPISMVRWRLVDGWRS